MSKRISVALLLAIGSAALVLVFLSFTDLPYWAYHRLGMTEQGLSGAPDVIAVLGGAGMPSPDGLIRTYYAAAAAKQYPLAEIIIALPYGEQDSLHQLQLMANELVVRGVDTLRISYEPLGHNTHAQAAHIASLFGEGRASLALLVVTSPEHMFRAIRCFEHEGFGAVGGMPTFEVPVAEKGLRDRERPGDVRVRDLSLRYNMWSYLHYELLVLREYCAIAYYKLKGWI